MSHPLEDVMAEGEPFLLIGDSSEDRFPATSYDCYTKVGRPFYCLDLGGRTESRGLSKGLKVYPKLEDVPEDRGDLALIWVKPRSAKRAVEVAHEAGCKRVWFSFSTGHRDAVARAKELEMEVVEIGRCPAYYLEKQTAVCKAHTLLTKLTGSYRRPPQLDVDAKRREMF